MDNKSKGIEITRQPTNDGISVASNGISIKTKGKLDIHFDNPNSYVYLIIDCSGSMAGYKIEQVKKGILEFTRDAIKKNYLVGLIQFDTVAQHISEPLSDITKLSLKLIKLEAKGTTNLTSAISMAQESLRTFNTSRAVVIATDGKPNDKQSALNAARQMKTEGIDIITIGTDDADQDFLQEIATRKELGSKVTKEMFAKTIASASNLLPAPKRIIKK